MEKGGLEWSAVKRSGGRMDDEGGGRTGGGMGRGGVKWAEEVLFRVK